MQTEDVAGIQGVAQEVGIALKGEAYAIDVAVKYPDPAAAILDYGLMKATQTATKSVTLVNTGKYAVAFAFHQRGAMMKELFSITPAEGNLAPGVQQPVELAFNRSGNHKLQVRKQDHQTSSRRHILLTCACGKQHHICVQVRFGHERRYTMYAFQCLALFCLVVAGNLTTSSPFCLVVADIIIKSSTFTLLATCRGQVLKREVTLADSTDITVAIAEPLTGRKEVTLPVKVSCSEQVTFGSNYN